MLKTTLMTLLSLSQVIRLRAKTKNWQEYITNSAKIREQNMDQNLAFQNTNLST